MERAESVTAPGIFDLTGKAYTAAKLRDLFDLRLLAPDGPLPDADVVVRLAADTALRSP